MWYGYISSIVLFLRIPPNYGFYWENILWQLCFTTYFAILPGDTARSLQNQCILRLYDELLL